MEVPILLGLGSNLGDREANIARACSLLSPGVTVLRQSALRETEPYGYREQPLFLNGALYGTTSLTPSELLRWVKETEKICGRRETFKWGPRVIDIDIIFYDNIIYDSPDLVIPHRDLRQRPFVIEPALEIIPETERLHWRSYITGTA
ncbi:MAG: 2-amino-4-hydroxy-6-hydroxymethyldihydropteridine diphosphokinase [Abditibacteriota bacterium]|nr:2-amino-4-hydroxy-6-hydroxymethyldihydropteridine diphosphokinase [Abditibacteriota bacterium]